MQSKPLLLEVLIDCELLEVLRLTDVLDEVRECELLVEDVLVLVELVVDDDDECELVLDELVLLDDVLDRELLVDSSLGSILNSAHSSTSISHWSVKSR
jgi:hypothetical protein